MVRDTLELKNIINAWKSVLQYDRFLMNPSMATIVKATIYHLERLDLLDQRSEKSTENNL